MKLFIVLLPWFPVICFPSVQILSLLRRLKCSSYRHVIKSHRIFYYCVSHFLLVGRPEGRRPLGRPKHRWKDNIKMDIQEVGWGMDWIELAQDRDRWRTLANAVINLRVP
jgi:hypothetical protein